eukprot:scaffold136559_cov14-Tisochrysis_lutea.AAC.2
MPLRCCVYLRCPDAGEYKEMRYLTENRTTLVFDIPLAEVVTDYFDVLKSKSKVGESTHSPLVMQIALQA